MSEQKDRGRKRGDSPDPRAAGSSEQDPVRDLTDEMETVVGDAIYIGGMTGLNDWLKESDNG